MSNEMKPVNLRKKNINLKRKIEAAETLTIFLEKEYKLDT